MTRPRTDAERQAARVARLRDTGRRAYTAFLPGDLVEWADAQAAAGGQSRAQWLQEVLARLRDAG